MAALALRGLTWPLPVLISAAALAASLLHAQPASALNLIDAYHAALQNDPAWRSARLENRAGQEYAAIGRSNLLPSVSFGYSTSRNRADITTQTAFGDNTMKPDYTSSASALSLRQPLLHPEGWARYRQGLVQTQYSDAILSARAQDLLLRVVAAYAEAQYGEEQLKLAVAQRDGFAEQRRVNDRMFDKGEGTRTDMIETQARLDLAEAQVIEAGDALANARTALAAIIGREVDRLDPLSEDFRPAPPELASFDEWKALALARNPDIAAQRLVVEASRLEIASNRAGHLPRVDLVASVGSNRSDTINTYNQDATVRSIGVQLTLPLYAGGAVQGATSQAALNYERARSDLDLRTDQMLTELRKQWRLVQSSIAKIDALAKSTASARLQVQATEQSVKGGVRINLDVLNAKQQLTKATGDLVLARYNALLGLLRLKSAAGVLDTETLDRIAVYFDGRRQ